ncbi:MAG: ribonuclease domain-containing protein [Nostocoides sp.]
MPASTRLRGPRQAWLLLGVVALVLAAAFVLRSPATPAAVDPVSASPTVQATGRATSGTSSPGAASHPTSDLSTATGSATPTSGLHVVAESALPAAARHTVALIHAGGPFPYRQDGSTFSNRERILPSQPRGYYREYTVKDGAAGDRGPNRIVGGAAGDLYWTTDHYGHFRQIKEGE